MKNHLFTSVLYACVFKRSQVIFLVVLLALVPGQSNAASVLFGSDRSPK